MTLPMSLALAAPVSSIAAAIAARDLVVAHWRRQERLDDGDLGALGRGEFRARALVVELGPIPGAA